MADPALKFMMFTLVRVNELPFMKLMPISPLPTPLIDRFRRFTVILDPLMLMPFVPAARTEPKVPPQSIVIDFVIVTAPKPPGSRQSISPFGAVLEIAPAKVLHGAVRVHGLASSPTPETHVRVAWARAGTACSARTNNVAAKVTDSEILCMTPSERSHRRRRRRSAQRHGRIGYTMWMVLSLRVPGATRAKRIASLLQSLTKAR